MKQLLQIYLTYMTILSQFLLKRVFQMEVFFIHSTSFIYMAWLFDYDKIYKIGLGWVEDKLLMLTICWLSNSRTPTYSIKACLTSKD